MSTDSPIRWMRRAVFGLTQDQFAAIGGVSRPRISRYETGGEDPPYRFMRRVRDAAIERGLAFNGDWFFEAPAAPVPVERANAVPEDVQ